MTAEAPHFKIHVAKAKDLPLSWFELVLCPEKFKKHLETLDKNPDAEPTAFQLIGTFLEKAGCLPGQTPPTEGALSEERRVTLVNCALVLGSLLRWDLPLLEKKLSIAVQCGLISQLCNAYVQEGPLFSKDSDTLMAHVIHSQWVLRFIFRHQHLPNLPSRSSTPAPDANNMDQIDSTTKPLVSTALDFLNGLLSTDTLPDTFKLPKVGVDLMSAGLGGAQDRLIPPDREDMDEWSRSRDHVLCEISYTLGCYYFTQDDLTRAKTLFNSCQEFLSSLPTPHTPMLVDLSKLRGFLLACESGNDGDSGVQMDDLTVRLEMTRLTSWPDIMDLLIEDFKRREIPLASRLCLERGKFSSVDTNKWKEEPPSKKMKLDADNIVPLEECLCAYNGLREVMENKPPLPMFWLLLERQKNFFPFVLSLCHKLLTTDLTTKEHLRLQSFVRTLCVGGVQGSTGWEELLEFEGHELASQTDQDTYKSMVSLTTIPDISAADDGSPLQTLESKMCQEVTAADTLTAVERLFKATPTAQHRVIALKWIGVTRGFVPLESLGDPLTFTKYNILVHRGKTLKQAKLYSCSVEMFACALKLLSPKTTPLSSLVRQQLEEYLREEILVLELMDAHSQLTPQNIEKKLHSGQLAPLIAKSKAYYMDGRHRSSSDSVTVHLTSALLLNTQHYSFLFSRETQLEPGIIAPRLASGVHCVKEGREMRKPIRDLFDAILTIFCPPLHSGEAKSEASERQSKLRANLDIFVENLMDTTSLSLLLAALARVWNLLEKPEFEVLSDYRNHWPTAIGTPGSIDLSQVYRLLSTTLSRSLKLQPDNTSWIVMQADLFCAKGNYGAAVHGYLSAGSLVSSHFQSDVPQEVWSQEVYRRLIACCLKLGYHTHAVILCQMLDPVDYEFAFSVMKTNVGSLTDCLFIHLWDMTIIEYLIYTVSCKGDKHKQKIAIQVAGQPELNFNNSSDVLQRAAQVRKRRFLRTFFTQMIP